MGLVAKMSGGKRVNFTSGGSFTRRCFGAAISHRKGPGWQESPWRKFTGRSPGMAYKRVMERRKNKAVKRRLQLEENPHPKRRRSNNNPGGDMEYGPNAAQPEIEGEELELKKAVFFESLLEEVASVQQCTDLERATVGQRENARWMEARRNRLTASNFGIICNRRAYTSCHNQV